MQDPQTTAYFYLVTVNPVFWTVLRPGPCSSFGGGPPKTDCWRGAAAVGHSRAAQQHPEATQLVVGSCWPAATNPSQCVAHSWQQPSPGESTHSHQCCQLHLISPSLSFHVLSLCIQYPPVCLHSLCRTWVSSPPQQLHNPSQQCVLFLTSQVPPHTQTKIPPRCSHINLKFLLPKPPTLLACCFSSSPNPPWLLYPQQWPLLPTFQTSLIFSAFLPLKHLLDVRSLRSTVPGTPRRRTSTSSRLLLQWPGLQGWRSLTQMAECLRKDWEYCSQPRADTKLQIPSDSLCCVGLIKTRQTDLLLVPVK